MSSVDNSVQDENMEVVFEVLSLPSSMDPPADEWSSLLVEIPEENQKKIAYHNGLFDSGSGEICPKYIGFSDSYVLKHPYFHYSSVVDPGIVKAILEPEDKVIYPDDGQELYLTACKEMDQCPVNKFYKSLLEDTINLKYYCVNPVGVHAMAIALQFNKTVTVLDLTDNFLTEDACFHLGEMLKRNGILRELVLDGCRIGPEGAKRLFAGLIDNSGLHTLNLNRNMLGDAGALHLASAIVKRLDLDKLYLSGNSLGTKAATALAEAMEFNNQLSHIDLSKNKLSLSSPIGMCNLLDCLQENKYLQELNLAWNSLSGTRIGGSLKNVLCTPSLTHLDLSNNKLAGEGLSILFEELVKAKKLVTLDLSYNPMDPNDAIRVLSKLKLHSVKVQNLLMDNVFVNSEFLAVLQAIRCLKSRKNTVITYGEVIETFKAKGPDMRELVLNRAEYLAYRKPKRNKEDIALIVMQILKDNSQIMEVKEFQTAIERSGGALDEDLVDEIVGVFPGPKLGKSNTINLATLVEYVKRKWPDRKLPQTPPPEPEVEAEPAVPLKNGKAKKVKTKGKKKE